MKMKSEFHELLIVEELRLMLSDIIDMENRSSEIFKSFKISDTISNIILVEDGKEIFSLYQDTYDLFSNNTIRYNDTKLLIQDLTYMRRVNHILRVMMHVIIDEDNRPQYQKHNIKLFCNGYNAGMLDMFRSLAKSKVQ